MFGLLDRDLQYIKQALSQLKEIEQAFVFGSRAMGNYKNGSDVDLAISGRDVSETTIMRLSDLLNEQYPLPYFFDILHYEKISNPTLKNHIDVEGKLLYSK